MSQPRDIRLSAAHQGRDRVDHLLEVRGGKMRIEGGLIGKSLVEQEMARFFDVLVKSEDLSACFGERGRNDLVDRGPQQRLVTGSAVACAMTMIASLSIMLSSAFRSDITARSPVRRILGPWCVGAGYRNDDLEEVGGWSILPKRSRDEAAMIRPGKKIDVGRPSRSRAVRRIRRKVG
jgi:hypothetical protein